MHDGSVFASPESDIPKTNSWRKGSFMLIKIKELNSWKILFDTFLLSIQDTNNQTGGVENAIFSWREIAWCFWTTGVFLGGKSHVHRRF